MLFTPGEISHSLIQLDDLLVFQHACYKKNDNNTQSLPSGSLYVSWGDKYFLKSCCNTVEKCFIAGCFLQELGT